MYAGFANGYVNRFTYLYQNDNYWAMSPRDFYAPLTGVREFRQSTVGAADGSWVTDGIGLRPVINLKSDVEISGGVGTSDNPYIVKTA